MDHHEALLYSSWWYAIKDNKVEAAGKVIVDDLFDMHILLENSNLTRSLTVPLFGSTSEISRLSTFLLASSPFKEFCNPKRNKIIP